MRVGLHIKEVVAEIISSEAPSERGEKRSDYILLISCRVSEPMKRIYPEVKPHVMLGMLLESGYSCESV